MSNDSLSSLLGSYDNLGEPVPTANKRETVLGVTIVFMILSWTCGLFRFYTRFLVNYAPGLDDFFLLLVLLTGLVGAICICMLPDCGLGQHFILLTEDQMIYYLKGFYVANSAYVMSTTLIKVSLLLQYLRVFKSPILRTVCYFLLITTSLWGFAYSFLAWVPCVPVYDFWSLTLAESDKTCFGYGSSTRGRFVETYLSHAGVNMTLDILILSLPIYLISKKIDAPISRTALLGLLLGGSVVVFISIWRLVTLVEHQAATYPTFDPSWYSPMSIILSAAEVNIAAICASVPVFWPVLTDSLGEIFVTKEVQISHEERNDEFELHSARSHSNTTFDEYSMENTNGSIRAVPSRANSHNSNYKRGRSYPFVRVSDVDEKAGIVRTHIRSDSGQRHSQR